MVGCGKEELEQVCGVYSTTVITRSPTTGNPSEEGFYMKAPIVPIIGSNCRMRKGTLNHLTEPFQGITGPSRQPKRFRLSGLGFNV